MPKKMKNPIDEMAKDAKAMGKSINKEIAKDAKAMGTMGKSINKEMAKDVKAVKKSINKALQPKKRRNRFTARGDPDSYERSSSWI